MTASDLELDLDDTLTRLDASMAVRSPVDRLERSVHLQRCPNPDDGRSRLVELTNTSREHYHAAMDSTNECLHELMSSFSDRDEARFVRITDHVVRALDGGAPSSWTAG